MAPAAANLHIHAFQRARIAGLAEVRGQRATTRFWTGRETMYRFRR